MNKFALDTKFDNVPYKVIKKAFNTLKAYEMTFIRYENGEYTEGPHASVKAEYAEDFRVVGCIRREDIYTPTEVIENYINEFQSYPLEYKGIRDYGITRKMADETLYNKQGTRCTRPYGKIDSDGNFQLVGLETIDLIEEILTLDPDFSIKPL